MTLTTTPGPKRIRLKVEIQGDLTSGGQLARYVVPISAEETVASLIQEIARRQDFPPDVAQRLRLTLADMSLLSEHDLIGDVLEPGEIVRVDISTTEPLVPASPGLPPTYREVDTTPSSANQDLGEESSDHLWEETEDKELGKQTKRVRIALITPELARNGGSHDSSKVMAFGGSAVSVDMSMDVIRREAARTLGWLDDGDAFGIHTPQDSSQALSKGSCSCSIANQIFTAGRFEQLHCPKQIDGTECGYSYSDCHYSHEKIVPKVDTSSNQLDCMICMEPFGVPCDKCLDHVDEDTDTKMPCPLVQNAGCKHIFHAHCYFSRAAATEGCPAGCSVSTTLKEAIPFDARDPYLLVVHSGFTVDKVSISRAGDPTGRITLKDDEVLRIISERYADLGSGLTVRMFGRKNSGLVSFHHSTVVSICCSSRHPTADGIIRFPLNGSAPAHQPDSQDYNIDLHTFGSPIFNESPNITISGLQLDDHINNNGEIVLYVVQRKRSKLECKEEDTKNVGRSAVYIDQDDWQPMVNQTRKGMATFLSSLLVFANYLSLYDKEDAGTKNMHDRIIYHLLALTRFPPAVRALHILTANETPSSEEMKALSETVYHLALDISHPSITNGDKSRVFEGCRILFGYIIERTKGPFTLSDLDNPISITKPFKKVSLTCELSGEPLRDPVQYGGLIAERAAVTLRQQSGPLFDVLSSASSLQPVPDYLPPLVHRGPKHRNAPHHIFVLTEPLAIPSLLGYKLTPPTLSAAIDSANVNMQIHAPLSLKDKVITPALTLDEVGYNAVYISRGGPCAGPGEDVILLRPCHGGEEGVDVNAMAVRLQPIIERSKAAGEWDIDAFGASRTDRVDTREIEEAVVIALDLSRSMERVFNPSSEADDRSDSIDPDQRAQDAIKAKFFERASDPRSVLSQVENFIKTLEDLPSIARYMLQGENSNRTSNNPVRSIVSYITRRSMIPHERATEVLDELVLLYSRLHWKSTNLQVGYGLLGAPPLIQIENFVTASLDIGCKATVVGYLIDQVLRAPETQYSAGVPMRLLDPFTGRIFVDPVRAPDGYVYERSSIQAWLEQHRSSPMNPNVILGPTAELVSDRDTNQSVMTFLSGRPRAAFTLPQLVQPRLIQISKRIGQELYLPLIGSVTILSILFDYALFHRIKPSKIRFWSQMEDKGDGALHGVATDLVTLILSLPSKPFDIGPLNLPLLELSHYQWTHMPSGAERERIKSRSLSRLDVVKQAFEAFINKSEAFDQPVAVGLVTFGREVKEVQNLTLLKENFRTAVQTVEADGDTPLYDSLSVAHAMLMGFKKEHPSCRLRIICLTDGEDVGSRASPSTIAAMLQRSSVVVDSITVQVGQTSPMHAVAVATGGYSFRVDTLENALNIVELEVVLQSKDRVEKPKRPVVRGNWQLMTYTNTRQYPVDVVTSEVCPERKPHERINQPVQSAKRVAATDVPPLSTARGKRLMQEIRDVVNQPHPSIDVYTGDDMAFWKIVIEAPEGSPYAGGTFLAYVAFAEDYPQIAPEIRFVTPILHPNINRHGKVCHAVFDRGWMVDMTMSVIFQILYGLLLTPDIDNPLDLHATMEYNDDTGQHALKVHDMVVKFASKDRAAWQRDFEGQ